MYEPKSHKGLFGLATGYVLALLGLILLVGAIIFGVRWLTAEPKGKLQAREQIQSGPFRIAAYEHFFNLCVAIQEDEGTITALEQELATKPSAERKEQINATLTALRANRNRSVRQYNADATKGYTVGQFQSRNLPYQLDPTTKETTCAIP